MTHFMGKHSATHDDVREFFNAYRDAGIDSISFSSLAVDVAKSLDSNRLPRYSANFTVKRRFWRGQDMPNTSMMRGNAVIDNYFKFDEFNLDKVADNWLTLRFYNILVIIESVNHFFINFTP